MLNNYLFQTLTSTKNDLLLGKTLNGHGCMGNCVVKENQVIKDAEILSKIKNKNKQKKTQQKQQEGTCCHNTFYLCNEKNNCTH